MHRRLKFFKTYVLTHDFSVYFFEKVNGVFLLAKKAPARDLIEKNYQKIQSFEELLLHNLPR